VKNRIGVVNYVNALPLARGLARDAAAGEIDLRRLSPAAVADGLAAGTIDVGLVPSIELTRIPGLEVVSGCAIAATQEVRSVLLVSRVPIPEIRRVALDENSRTSAVLVRILLAERYGLTVDAVPAVPDVRSMLAEADAALLIGDPALRVERQRFVVLDLAAEWLLLTGLPFVFAVWAARMPASPGLAARLDASLAAGLEELDSIVAEASRTSGFAEVVLRDYYTRNLSFRLGAAEIAGLREFLRRAAAHGWAPPDVEPAGLDR